MTTTRSIGHRCEPITQDEAYCLDLKPDQIWRLSWRVYSKRDGMQTKCRYANTFRAQVWCGIHLVTFPSPSIGKV